MSWVKIDDGIADHPKLLAAGPHAFCLWVCGLAYCNRQPKRDGFIPELKVPLLYPVSSPMKQAAKLVEIGLWERADGGFRIHDYHDFQPTEEEVADRRMKRAEAGRRGGLAKAAKQAASKVLDPGQPVATDGSSKPLAKVCPVPVPVPVPEEGDTTKSDPSQSLTGARSLALARPRAPDAFLDFWGAYPRKVGKQEAQKVWAKLNPNAATVEAMAHALSWQRELSEWHRDEGRYVPHPATWLRGRRWEDEPPPESDGMSDVGREAAREMAAWLERRREHA